MTQDRLDMKVQIAEMYYRQNMSQQEIAKAVNMSRTTVSRILKLCIDEGIVTIHIKNTSSYQYELERKLQEKYGLKYACVVNGQNDFEASTKMMGEALADYLKKIVNHNFRIGISAGTTVASMIYELQKITNKLEDTKLAHKMVQKAVSLPTSHDNHSAFVMKCVEYSSDKIGYNMVAGSAGSIDHLIPFVKNGKDNLQNYGISSAYYNSERAQRPMQQQLKKYPQTYENCQKQVDRLIELYNDGTFKKIGLPKHYITNFVRRMYNLSPEDNRLILNIDKLKQ